MKKNILLISIVLLLQGCAYALSSASVGRADKTISFEMLRANPNAYKGKLVILGGTIAQTSSVPQGTVLEVVQKSLDYWGKPLRTNRTGGSFLLYYPGHLDSLTYSPGREITVAAEIAGSSLNAVERIQALNSDSSSPILIAKELRLWERMQHTSEPKSWDPLTGPIGGPRPQQY